MSTLISIHSTGRADFFRRGSSVLRFIPKSLQKETIVFCRRDEYEDYKTACSEQGYNCSVQYIPDVYTTDMDFGVIHTRQFVIERAKKIKVDKLFMIDDDLKLATCERVPYEKPIYTTFDQKHCNDFSNMYEDMSLVCSEKRPMVGITARQFSQQKKEIERNTRLIQLVALHVPTLEKHNIDFKPAIEKGLRYMSDYYLCLKLLYLGYQNVSLNFYTRDDYTNSSGGCSIRRTTKEQSKSALILKDFFPEVVTPFVKTNGKWKEKRINVRISWKKALGMEQEKTEGCC